MSKLVYDFYSDGGHGWLKVSIDELIKLGIQKEISSASYIRNDSVYLEEDCDAYLFIKAKEKIGEKIRENSHQSDHPSKIRNYEPYDYIKYVEKTEWNKIDNSIHDAKDNQEVKEIIKKYKETVKEILN